MTKFDDIKKTLPPAQAFLPDAPAIANEMRACEEALALDALKDRATRADGPPIDLATALSLIPAREYRWVDPPQTLNPIADIHEAVSRATKSLTTFAFAGPVPVDFTLASAALNRGEAPGRRWPMWLAPRGAR